VPRRRTALILLLAAVLFTPLVVLQLVWDRPFVASTFASIAAIAFHDVVRYRRDRRRTFLGYAAVFALAIALSLGATALSLPFALPATATAVLVLASPQGRACPPLACVSFAVPVSGPIGTLVLDWAVAAAAAAYVLTALVPVTGLLTRRSGWTRAGR
jgi:hypothetical protein